MLAELKQKKAEFDREMSYRQQKVFCFNLLYIKTYLHVIDARRTT